MLGKRRIDADEIWLISPYLSPPEALLTLQDIAAKHQIEAIGCLVLAAL